LLGWRIFTSGEHRGSSWLLLSRLFFRFFSWGRLLTHHRRSAHEASVFFSWLSCKRIFRLRVSFDHILSSQEVIIIRFSSLNTGIPLLIIVERSFLGLFDFSATAPSKTSVVISLKDCSSAGSLFLGCSLEITTSTFSSCSLVGPSDFDQLELIEGSSKDLFLGDFSLLDRELDLLLLMDLLSLF
jgi:hypothetical protein